MPPSTAHRSLDSITDRAPRWIEFWTDAATAGEVGRDRFLEVPKGGARGSAAGAAVPEWLLPSLERAGSMQARGGWGATEVEEMTMGGPDGGEVLALTLDRCCGELRRGGWPAEEVVEMLGVLLAPRKARRATVALATNMAARVGRNSLTKQSELKLLQNGYTTT
ncbi:proline-rich protein 36 [Panicum miliaceum]|uniref:Proline-rich protein 36 n=1 Tax=Panicum miliaceum TaxID=4540 RepID=A0A3L6T218_PANMI|nr:proline-rich protein 36 [Panicum miliaceum]